MPGINNVGWAPAWDNRKAFGALTNVPAMRKEDIMRDFGHGFFISPEALVEVSKALAPSAAFQDECAATAQPRAPRLCLLDVRSTLTGDRAEAERDYAAGHLPQARLLDFERCFTGPRTGVNGRHPWPEVESVRSALFSAGLRPRDRLVFIDGGAMNFAARALLCARSAGFLDCAVLEGGFALWRELGLPAATGLSASEGAAIVGCEGAAAENVSAAMPESQQKGPRVLGLQEVLEGLEQKRIVILDARPRKRWLGEEPSDIALDGAAGHIPGSLNRPAADNADAFGRIKSPERLRLEFETLLSTARAAPESLVHACGSGVAACLNVLAMDRAGLVDADRAMIYGGSWSEWARHPALPVEKGEPRRQGLL